MLGDTISPNTAMALCNAQIPDIVVSGSSETAIFTIRKDGVEIHMQSRRDPLGEAERIASAWLEEDKPQAASCIVICGACGLYHINAVAKSLPPGVSLFIAEANPGILRKTLESCNLEALVKSGIKFTISTSNELRSIADDLRDFLAARYIEKTYIHVQPSIKRLMPEYSAELQKILEKTSDIYKTDLLTSIRTSGLNFNNFLKNLNSILRSPGIAELKGIFKGRCGLITGAGPSLTDSLDIIKEHRDKFILFACGTSLKTLLKAGISPDLAVSTDSDPKVFKQFETLDSGDLPLAASIFSTPALVEKHAESLFFFTTHTQKTQSDWLLKATKYNYGELNSSGTVAISAMDLASYCGCSEIILCGIDLSFTDNGTTHATDSIYDGQKENTSQLFHVKGKYGRQVLTNMQFAQYIEIMSDYIETKYSGSGIRIINMGEGGAYIGGTEEMNLEDFKAMMRARENITGRPHITRNFRDKCPRPANPEQTLQALDAEFLKIKKAAESISDALSRTLKYGSTPTLEKRIKTDEASLKSSPALPLCSGIILPALMQMEKDIAAYSGNTTKILEKSINLYEHIEDAAAIANRQLAAVRKI